MATVVIRPKGASFAKTCPERVQLDVLQPCEPLPDSPFLQKLFRAGDVHEDETIGGVFDDVEGAVVIEADDPDAREWHTRQAIAQGARLIAGGRLPVDYDGHRVGEPDLLVACGQGYLPVDVKSHKSLEPARPDRTGGGNALISDVAAPYFETARVDVDVMARRHVGDLLQLAHYRRLLETAGLASTGLGHNVGGICGTEGVVVWYDLDAPVLEAPEHVDVAGLPRRISPMERYDLEFGMRLRVSVAAELHLDDPSEVLLAEPIVCKDCAMCRWREWCGPQLEAVADLSLVSGVGVGRRRLYMEHGVADLYALAGLDWTTAELVRRGVDLTDLQDRVREGAVPGPTPLASIIPKRKKQLEDLAALGFVTAGDLAALDGRTFVLAAAGGSSVASQIELARARVGGLPAYRRRDVVSVEVPRADIEVDVDMESTNDGCYLWGALATDRREAGAEAQYLSFATWNPDLEEGELVAFGRFWSWLCAVRERAAAAGASFRAYCYSRSAEEGQMKRLGELLGLRDEVDAFLASDEWVDLLEVVRGQLVTGRSMGLKETAPLAGFAWRFDDAGGTLAMVKYDEAVDQGAADAASRKAAAQWILEYNEDDVRATAALRAWLDGAARMLPSIASWDEERRSAA